jgi:anti-sigma factor RsiW
MAEAPHREWRERLGAYALGHLTEDEAAAVRAHLDGCPQCRGEAVSLAPVAQRLSLGSPELVAAAAEPPRDLGDRVMARVARARRSDRRRRRRTAVAVAVAAALGVGGATAAAVVLSAGESGQPAAGPSETVAFRDLPPGVKMRATVAPRAWGTSVAVAVDGEPAGIQCTVWLRRADGTRVPAGSFRYVDSSDGTSVDLASSLPRSDAVAIDLRAGSYTYVAPLS